MTPSIYVSDLDGTLLGPEARLSAFSRRGLHALLAAGVPMTFATARSGLSTRQVLDGLPLRLPLITFNGICTVDPATGRRLKVRTLNPQVVPEIVRMFEAAALEPFVVSTDGAADHSSFRRVVNDGMDWYVRARRSWNDKRLREVADLADSLREQVFGINVIERREVVHELRDQLRANLAGRIVVSHFEDCYCPGWHWLTVSDAAAAKEIAVAELLAEAGYEPSRLVAYGDNHNDVGMLRLAGRGIAVANADDEVKALADEVIGANDTDSVVRHILADRGMPLPESDEDL